MVEKFTTPAPLPTAYQREILTILIEECAEVQQRATKMLRFGIEETQPMPRRLDQTSQTSRQNQRRR